MILASVSMRQLVLKLEFKQCPLLKATMKVDSEMFVEKSEAKLIGLNRAIWSFELYFDWK
jgi:hypothetical protein